MSKTTPGWCPRRLQDVASGKKFAIVDGPFGTQLHADEYVNEGVPLVRVTNTSYEGRFLENDIAFITEHKANMLARSEVVPDDIIVAKTGATIGKLAMFPSHFTRGIIASSCIKLSIDPAKADPRFVFFLLSDASGQKQILDAAGGSTRTTINCGPFGAISFKFPPSVSEQCRIVEILSTVDEVIEQTEALIAKYQQIKTGLMHDLFTRGVTPDGHLRPTREQAPHLYRESPLGWIPNEWEVRRLGVILKECGGYFQTGPFGSQLHAYEYQHVGVPVVMPQDINDGIISTEQIARISERRSEELSRHRMKTGDIVIARRGDLSRASLITNREETWLCGTGCFLLRLGRSSLHADFAALVYRHDVVQRQIAGMAVGTTMPSLNNNVMERVLFPYCDPDEQSRITERLDGLDQSLRFTQCHLANSTQIKHGLMHDLLTGRVRVNVAEPV